MCTEVKEEEKTSVQFKHVIYKVFKKKKKRLPGSSCLVWNFPSQYVTEVDKRHHSVLWPGHSQEKRMVWQHTHLLLQQFTCSFLQQMLSECFLWAQPGSRPLRDAGGGGGTLLAFSVLASLPPVPVHGLALVSIPPLFSSHPALTTLRSHSYKYYR